MIFSYFVLLFYAFSAGAELKSVTVRWEDKVLQSRWLYEEKPKISEKGLIFDLYKIKKAEFDKNFELCFNLSKRTDSKSSPIHRWLILQKLNCSLQNFRSKNKGVDLISEVFFALAKEREYLSTPFGISQLRTPWLDAGLIVFDSQVRSRSKQSWRTYDILEEFSLYLSRGSRAELYRLGGEVAFYEQNLALAVSFFERSLDIDPRSAVQERFSTIKKEYYRSIKKPIPPDSESTNENLFNASLDELKLDQKFRDSVQRSDWLAAVEDGVELIKKYPGGTNAQFAHKQILNIYLGLASRKEEKFINLKSRILSLMNQIDGARIYEWAQVLVQREFYDDAVALAEKSAALLQGQTLSTAVLLSVATSHLHLGQFKKAIQFYEKLVIEHAGTEASLEASFRLGLLHFRSGEFAESSTYFEKYISTRVGQKASSDFDIPALYWMWRAQQNLKNQKADEVAKELIRRFPLSYFALRARAEMNGQKLNFDKKQVSPKAKAQVYLSAHELEAWERFLVLARAGWHFEAQEELAALPQPTDPEGLIIWARLWSSVMGYNQAFDALSQAWREDQSLINESSLRLAYPKEFFELIETESKRVKLSPILVLSLIRQESGFKANAVSRAQAQGLMQVLPTTAKEIANDLKLKITTSDLFNPSTNLRIGTVYLSRLLKKYEGNLPLALAAYNAGIGNINGWLQSRKDLNGLKTPQPQIQAEIWFDELPWSETSGYIKSILRNIIVYQVLDQGELALQDPVWRF